MGRTKKGKMEEFLDDLEIFHLKPLQKQIAEKMGGPELCCQLSEEMSELNQVLMTYRRLHGFGQKTEKDIPSNMYAIHEEVTDVIIYLKELIYMLNLSTDTLEYIEAQKMERTRRRYGIRSKDETACSED